MQYVSNVVMCSSNKLLTAIISDNTQVLMKLLLIMRKYNNNKMITRHVSKYVSIISMINQLGKGMHFYGNI